MGTVTKVIVGVLTACVLLATVIIGANADRADNAISSARSEDMQAGAEFDKKFKKVKLMSVVTGKSGMSLDQVAAILGKPKPSDITEETSPGITVTTWTWSFVLSDRLTIYTVKFLNGQTSTKSKA